MNIPINELMLHGGTLFVIAIIIIGGIICQLAIGRFLSYLHKREYLSPPIFQVARAISRYFVLFVVLLFLLQQTGVKVSSIINSLLALAAMVAIGFIAVWSVFSNFLCSLMLVIFSPFKIGDEIEITEPVGGAGLRGQVVDFNIMYTAILESGDQPEEQRALIRVPNNIFFQKAVKRWKGRDRKRIEKYLLNKSLQS